MSVNFDLKATTRTKLGSAESRRIRKAGNIPSTINNGGNNVELSVPSKEFEKEYLKGDIFTTLINLDIEGKTQKVIVNKIDLNPVTDRIAHVSFVKADSKKVKAKVKVTFFGREKSPGIRKGGYLHITSRKVELLCPVDEIPQEIRVSISKMRVGHKVRSNDVELPENVSFANKNIFNIASIIGRGAKEEEEEVVEVEGEDGATEDGESADVDKAEGGEAKADDAKVEEKKD